MSESDIASVENGKSELPKTVFIPLEEDTSGDLSSVSEASFVGVHAIGSQDLLASTTVTDVRYGRYCDGVGEADRTACLIVLKFGFSQHAKKRMKKLRIYLSFSAAGQRPSTTSSTAGVDQTNATDLPQLRHYEPSFGQGQTTSAKVIFESSAGLSIGVPLGSPLGSGPSISGTLRAGTERVQTASATVTSFREGTAAVSWFVQESAHEKEGIPPELNCAVVLRVGGDDPAHPQSFVGSVKFETQVRSVHSWFKGSKTAFIESQHFQHRTGGLSEAQEALLKDMGSDGFLEWVKERANNHWIAT